MKPRREAAVARCLRPDCLRKNGVGGRCASGFTLVELAVVVAIMALLLGGLLVPLSGRVELGKIREGEEKLQEIRNAILGYAMVHGRLPCPDCMNSQGHCSANNLGDGEEDCKDDCQKINEDWQCSTLWGWVPWTTLSTRRNDPWGVPWYYRISEEYATGKDSSGGLIRFDTRGDISVYSDTPKPKTNPLARQVPAVVLSTGPNGNTRKTAAGHELENLDEDRKFIYHPSVKSGGRSGEEYDDLMLWISPFILKKRLVDAGKLP